MMRQIPTIRASFYVETYTSSKVLIDAFHAV